MPGAKVKQASNMSTAPLADKPEQNNAGAPDSPEPGAPVTIADSESPGGNMDPSPKPWRTAASRLAADSAARYVVTGGGITVIAAIMAIMLVIAIETMPLFFAAKAAILGGGLSDPGGAVLAATSSVDLYSSAAPDTTLSPLASAQVGGSQNHTNEMPFTCVNFIIALFGIYPSRS